MAARGSESKDLIVEKILSTFDGAFKYDKEIRIPMIENGEEIQIKVTLTAAKTNVEHSGDTILPNSKNDSSSSSAPIVNSNSSGNIPMEPTDQEKENIKKMLASLF